MFIIAYIALFVNIYRKNPKAFAFGFFFLSYLTFILITFHEKGSRLTFSMPSEIFAVGAV